MPKMESRYETIKKMNGEFLNLVRIGIVPVNLTLWVIVYEQYKKQLENVKSSQAVQNVAEDNDLQRRQVYNIIKYMSTSFETR